MKNIYFSDFSCTHGRMCIYGRYVPGPIQVTFVRLSIKDPHCLVRPRYICKSDLVFSLIDSFLSPRDYFFPREPLDQSEISALPQIACEQAFSRAGWGEGKALPFPRYFSPNREPVHRLSHTASWNDFRGSLGPVSSSRALRSFLRPLVPSAC